MKKFTLLAGSLASISALIIGCGGGSSSTTTSNSYNGPGSDYKLELKSNNEFTLEESDSSLNLTGTWSALDSGFKKLTVTSSNKPSNVAVNSQAYILEVPGVMTLLKPIGSNTQIINMVTSGSCPTSDVLANWVNTNKNIDMATQKNSRDLFGTYQYTHSSTSAILPNRYTFNGTDQGSNSIGSLSCDKGIVTGSSFKMYLTQAGGAIVRTEGSDNTLGNSDDDFIIAFSKSSISSYADLDGNYTGLVFEKNSTEENIFPVSMSFSNGTGSGNAYSNLDTNTLSTTDTVSANMTGSVDSPSNGFFSITLGSGANTGTAKCMANKNIVNSGKNLIYCIGENPGDNSKLYNLLLVSK